MSIGELRQATASPNVSPGLQRVTTELLNNAGAPLSLSYTLVHCSQSRPPDIVSGEFSSFR